MSDSETIEDESGSRKKRRQGAQISQTERDDIDIYATQDARPPNYRDRNDRTHSIFDSRQHDAMTEEFYGSTELSTLHQRHNSEVMKRKWVASSPAVVETGLILREELKQRLGPEKKKTRRALPSP